MIHFEPILKGAGGMTGAIVSGGVVTLAAESITDATTVQIGIVGGLVVAVFYAGTTLQKLKDGQKSTDKRLSRIERKLDIAEDDD